MINSILRRMFVLSIPPVFSLILGTLAVKWTCNQTTLIIIGVIGIVSTLLAGFWEIYISEKESQGIKNTLLLNETRQQVISIRNSLLHIDDNSVRAKMFVVSLKHAFGDNCIQALITLGLIKKEEIQ